MLTPLPRREESKVSIDTIEENISYPDPIPSEEFTIIKKTKAIHNCGRSWTMAHYKLLLRNLEDKKLCLFEKLTSTDKKNA